jgi:hydrogenase nickel incorporation protein HypA/HybF
MHELYLTDALLDIMEDCARRERFAKVRSLKLSFGCLAGIDPAGLEFAFSVQAKGTKAEGAHLEFDVRPAVLFCLACEREVSSETWQDACPSCGGGELLLTGGAEEMKLLEMEVD